MNMVVLGILGYILLQLVIGMVVSRKINNEDDYLLAGRSLGMGLATFSVFATWFGAESCIGAAGAVYTEGLAGASADPFAYTACLLIMGFVFAIPLWQRQLTTLADLFRQRYSEKVEKLSVFLIAPTGVMWAAAQIRAFGQVLSASSHWQIELTIAIAAGVVIIYTMYGGLLADVVTDAVQGIALILGLLILWYTVFNFNGDVTGTINSIDASRSSGKSGQGFLDIVEVWAIPICGSVIAQELVARVLGCRTPQIARRACLAGGLIYLIVGMIPVSLGLLGYHLMPGLTEPEQILPALAEKHLHTFLYIIFSGALISAILSTVDSALLGVSALFSHNLIIPLAKIEDEAFKVRIARIVVMTSGLLAYWLALHAEKFYDLVKEASAFGSAGLFVVAVFGLFTGFGGILSAYSALITGFCTWIAGKYLIEWSYPYLISLTAALLSYTLAAYWEQHHHKQVSNNKA
jgi:Na+/proline symporter